MSVSYLIFVFFAGLTLLSGMLMILQKSPMRSVLYLAFSVLSVGGVFFTLQADFVGAIQVVVYAGGIVVLYLFVIIIINLNEMKSERLKFFPLLFQVSVPFLVLAELLYVLFLRGVEHGTASGQGVALGKLSESLLSTYLIPFEVSSVLLLAVLIGAIIIARKKVGHEPDSH